MPCPRCMGWLVPDVVEIDEGTLHQLKCLMCGHRAEVRLVRRPVLARPDPPRRLRTRSRGRGG